MQTSIHKIYILDIFDPRNWINPNTENVYCDKGLHSNFLSLMWWLYRISVFDNLVPFMIMSMNENLESKRGNYIKIFIMETSCLN